MRRFAALLLAGLRVPATASRSPGRTEGELLSFGNASIALAETFDDVYRNRPREQWLRGAP